MKLSVFLIDKNKKIKLNDYLEKKAACLLILIKS